MTDISEHLLKLVREVADLSGKVEQMHACVDETSRQVQAMEEKIAALQALVATGRGVVFGLGIFGAGLMAAVGAFFTKIGEAFHNMMTGA